MSRQRTGTRNIPLFRLSQALLLAAVLLPGVTPRSGSPDPEFTRLPFAEWAAQGKQSAIHWAVDVPPAQLSAHQRLMVRVTLTVDGRELARRLGKGSFVALVQYEDSAHRLWQNHASVNLAEVRKGVAGSDVQISHYAFVLPGDYTLSLAVCDTATLEHNFVTRKLHVAALKDDPLPDSWAGLPAVEFVRADVGTPDIWFLPDVEGHLNLPAVTKRPVQVEVLVNMTPSERASGSLTAMRRNMSLLIPALKILSGIKLANGSVNAALLDLTHQRIAWEQRDIHSLDWTVVRRALVEDEPGKIDVRALQGEGQMRGYFLGEIRRRMEAPGEMARVIVILSGPAFFQNQDPAEAGEATVVTNIDPNRRLIYIRDRSMIMQGRGGRGRGIAISIPNDDVERALHPLNPRVYDSTSAAQFRQILAEVLQRIAAM